MKQTELKRLFALIPYLENHPGISREAVAERLGCSPAEVSAILNQVLMCGSPPYLPDDYIGFSIVGDAITLRFSSHFCRPIRLTPQEALSVLVLLSEVGIYTEGAFARVAVSLRTKLTEAIESTADHDVGRIAERVTLTRGAAVPGQIVARLEAAIVERREMALCYFSVNSDRTTCRRVRPYGLVENTGDVYLAAYCCDRQAVRTFRVDRIKSLELHGETFESPTDFDLEYYGTQAFGVAEEEDFQVRIRLTGESADRVREAFEPGSVREVPEGVVLTIRSGSPEWVMRFCLKFGSDAEILSPPAIRQQMVITLQQVRALYK